MSTAAAVRSPARRARPDQLYLWVWGAMLVVLGGLSLVIHPDFATGDKVTGEHLFGVIETNGWHGLAGLTVGILSLAFARSRRWAPTAALLVGVLGGILPALALFAAHGGVALGVVPADNVDAVTLHLIPGVLGVAAAAAAWRQARP